VLAEAAGREHHAAGGFNAPGHTMAFEHDAFDLAIPDDEFLHRRLRQHVDASRLERKQQPADQRVAHREPRAARARQPVEAITSKDFASMDKGFPGPPEIEQMVDVGTIHHHAAQNREFRDRRPDAMEIGAERTAVERDRLQRAPTQGRAFVLLLIIRMGRVRPKLDVGIGFERGDGLRSAFQKSRAQFGRRAVADNAVEKGRDLVQAVIV
jgi:hypothetical protein